MTNFNEIAIKYERNSIVQKSASEVLFDLLEIQPNDNVLDLGCGTGHISKIIRDKTNGKIIGIDPPEGMIEKAREKYSNQNIVFKNCLAEQITYEEEFEIIFCNSVFQWFVDRNKALTVCYNALKPKGKIAIQAPAKETYCPNFLQAIENVKKNKLTRKIFAGFNSPWFFLNTAEEYSGLFEQAGFHVNTSFIDKIVTTHSVDETYKIFESGAAAGYLDQNYYSTQLSQDYIGTFKSIIRESFEKQANKTGSIDLAFYRIYLLAQKI